MSHYTLYIDEAGDLGINRGTQWFVLTGVLIDKVKEKVIKTTLADIKAYLDLDYIHFRQLRNYEQRCYVVNKIDSCDFTVFNILVDTNKITLRARQAGKTTSGLTYNYAVRQLLEQVGETLCGTGNSTNIVLSSRGAKRDQELIYYITEILIKRRYRYIGGGMFNQVTAKPAPSWEMLQLADVCATSMFYSLEINQYGFVIPCFIRRLKTNHFDNGGIKYYAWAMIPPKDYYKGKTICEK